MSASTKLSTSVKALTFLATQPDTAHTSSEIGEAIGINASKLRSLLSKMAKQGVVRTIKGKDGGFQLNKDSADIHLQEIYCAIEDRRAFYLDVQNGEAQSQGFAQPINHFFDELFFQIQVDIESKMKEINLQTIINKTLAQSI